MIAMQRREEHWLLSEGDATKYGKALANALRHFPVRTTQKAIDMTALLMTAIAIEAPRVALSRRNRRPQQQRPSATVFQFTRPAGAPSAASGDASQPNPASAPPPMAEGPQDFNGIGGEGGPTEGQFH